MSLENEQEWDATMMYQSYRLVTVVILATDSGFHSLTPTVSER